MELKRNYFLSRTGAPYEMIKGLLAENFVYLVLKRRIKNTSEIAGIAPWFSTYEKMKGATKGGIAEDRIFTVPLCLADRIQFENV